MAPRTLLITGGGRGIGAATARLAASRGYAVGINYHRNAERAEELVEEIQQAGGQAVLAPGDVSVEADVVALFEQVETQLGPIGGLVNNAGIIAPQLRLDAMSAERIERLLAVNVLGSLLCAREAVRRMSPQHGGAGGVIVNLSSAAARHGSPGEFVDYGATKGAIDTFTVGLAKEVAAEGIRVCGVRPGIIATEIHTDAGFPGRAEAMGPSLPMERSGDAVEVAQAILWLLSDEASYVTGAILDVAGGR